MTGTPGHGDPQAAVERRVAARHLVLHPLTCKEHHPDEFRLIRRHEAELDRWFTQRLGYRLHVGADTARLFKTAVVPDRRPLRTAGYGRPFHQLEYVVLVLVLASTVAGPSVTSLRDLVDLVRSAAAEAGVALAGDATERRAIVTAVRWMIDRGLAAELHDHVDAYAADADADAVLSLRPDRIALLPLPALGGFDDEADLVARGNRREPTRQWLRARLVEEPVVYRDDVTELEWAELRRRLGEEERYLDEMYGLVLEVRGEGVAAIDPAGTLSERAFPTGGTVGHAGLLLIEVLRADGGPSTWWPIAEITARLSTLAGAHASHWSGELVNAPERLTRAVVDLLVDVRLAELRVGVDGADGVDGVDADGAEVRLLPAAGRFAVSTPEPSRAPQDTLW